MIPATLDAWKKCIEQDCKIKLTKAFALERLAVYQDATNPETKQFVSLYGKQHLHNIINWLQRI